MTLRALTVLSTLILSSTLVFAAPERETLHVFEDVQEEVHRYAFYTIFDDVNIGIDERGVVSLTGYVTGPHKSRDLENRIAGVKGVTAIVNALEVLRVSRHDDKLRYAVARAIYGNTHFWRYAIGSTPPIHIVVSRGHVTLTGVVTNAFDRQLAETFARRVLAFSVTNELRTNKEARAELELLN